MAHDRRRDADALAALFGMAGVAHFVVPGFLRSVVPPWLARWAGPIVAVSGVAELAVSAALLHPASRRRGAQGAAGLIVAFLVAHVDAAVRARRDRPRRLERPVGVAVRLVVNVGYLVWALAVARREPPGAEASTTSCHRTRGGLVPLGEGARGTGGTSWAR